MRKRRQSADAAQVYIESVSMQTLDKELSRHVEIARSKPVPVDRYGVPWVWIVSHPVWMAADHLKSFVPADHPLVALRETVDSTLAYENVFLGELFRRCHSGMEGRMVMRAWLLQVVYSLSDPRRVREGLIYNMLWRWFVGYTLRSDPLPEIDAFVADLNRVSADPHAVDIVYRCLSSADLLNADNEEFRINRGLLHVLRTHHLQVGHVAKDAPAAPASPLDGMGLTAVRS